MTALGKDEADRKKMASYVEFAWRKYNLAFRAYMVELGMYDFFKENLYSEAVCARPDGDAWDVDEPDFRTKRESHEWEAFRSRMWRYELRALADMDQEFKDTYFELENNAASELFRLLDLWKIQNSGI